jgi:hypothetical protein
MPRIVRFEAAIADSSSAIKVPGGQGDAARIMLDCYVGNQILELAQLRGHTLQIIIGPVDQMRRVIEAVEEDGDQVSESRLRSVG